MKVLLLNRALFQSPILWLARFGWLAIFLLVAGMYAANLPYVYLDTATEWRVGEALPAALQLFPSKVVFIQFIILLRFVTATAFFGTALFIAWRRSNDWFVLFVSAALMMLSFMFGYNFDVSIIRYPFGLGETFPVIRTIAPSLLLISMILLFHLFPDGRFTTRWTAWLVLPATIMILLFFTAAIFGPWDDPEKNILPNNGGWFVFVFTLLGTVVAGLTGQIIRYRRNNNLEQRQQTKWALLGLSSLILGPLFDMVIRDLLLGRWVSYSFNQLVSLQLSIFVPMFLPLTIAFSILRYRLWDVDLVINRALVYGALTALILALYGLSVGLVSALIPTQNRWLLSAVALGVVVLLAAQLRPHLQTIADRWLPAPPPTSFPDDTVNERGQATPAQRLARAAWLLMFAFLLWQFVAHFATVGNVLTAIRSEWIVQTSLPALPGVSAIAFSRYLLLLRLAVLAVFWGTAVLIFRLQRHDSMALLVAFFLLLAPISFALSGDESWLEERLSMVVIGMTVLLPFLFPDGHFIPRSARWRGLLLALALITPLLAYPLVSLFRPDTQPEERVYGSFISTIAVTMTAGLLSQIYRYRMVATPKQRQQTKWVLLGLGLVCLWLLWGVLWLVGVLDRLGVAEALVALVIVLLSVLALAALPVTIAISILRYRLWEIDFILNRSLVFGTLTLLIAAAYVVVVGILGRLFQAANSVFLTILATGLIAILFHPLRQRLQQAVNRLMYGDRDDPAMVLSRLIERLANTAIPGEILPTIVETIAQTLKLPYVAIVQQDSGDGSMVVEFGKLPSETEGFPLVYQGQAIGQLLAAPRTPGEAFTPTERRLLENIAKQAGAAVVAAQLTQHLQHSRQQLVTSREEERRRIRRDLHDGLGPQLATMSLKLDAIGNYLTNDRESTERLLHELKDQVQDAIQDIRRLVYDLRPPALDQLGLVPALREFAAQHSANGLHIRIDAPETLPPLPAAVEVAAYRIALEALTNTARHAHASQCTLRLKLEDELCLEIMDNGVGLPAQPSSGVGLASMRERTAELGGEFSLQSKPGAGTHLTIRLPLA
jgi:signal transduction histidine kinase